MKKINVGVWTNKVSWTILDDWQYKVCEGWASFEKSGHLARSNGNLMNETEKWTSSRGGATMQTSPYRVFRIPILCFLKYDNPNRVHEGCSRDVNTSNSACTRNRAVSSDKRDNICCGFLLSGQWLKKGRDINGSYDKTSIWNEKTGFKNGVDSPCLATSHTNNRERLNHAHDENSKSNDNRVIWGVLDMVEEGPLVRCTTARYYHKNTRPRKCHEPCGYWE